MIAGPRCDCGSSPSSFWPSRRRRLLGESFYVLEFCFCAEVTIGWVYSAFLCPCTLGGLLLCVMCVGTWLYVVGRFCVIKYKKRKNDGRQSREIYDSTFCRLMRRRQVLILTTCCPATRSQPATEAETHSISVTWRKEREMHRKACGASDCQLTVLGTRNDP
jgi:hypothetical protein